MGLGAAATFGSMSAACGESDRDGYAGGGGEGAADSPEKGPAVTSYGSSVSSYGTGPSVGPGPASGAGSTGGNNTTTGDLDCAQFGDDTPCAVCLSENCCPEGEACQGECITAMLCLDACDRRT